MLVEIKITNKKIIVYFSVLSVVGAALLIVSSAGAKPFDDSPANHEELKQIPEVAAFYQKYEQYGIDILSDGAFTYQVGFQAENEEKWIMLRINYLYGSPFSSTVFCTPDGIESQYRITNNVLGYLKEQQCF